jgi:hypothetical protein
MKVNLLSFLETPELAELGPGPRADVEPLGQLNARLDAALGLAHMGNEQGQLLRAVVLLWHDHLDASHSLAQAVENRDGSYVHAIMHRREPDYGNAKYWFHRVGRHSCYESLAAGAAGLIQKAGPESGWKKQKLLPEGRWDAFGFVDACEEVAAERRKASSPNANAALLQQIQRVEFELLITYLQALAP